MFVVTLYCTYLAWEDQSAAAYQAAQEAGAPHREYIYRKKVNAIFTPLQLRDSLSD